MPAPTKRRNTRHKRVYAVIKYPRTPMARYYVYKDNDKSLPLIGVYAPHEFDLIAAEKGWIVRT